MRAQWRLLAGAILLLLLITVGLFYYQRNAVPQFPIAAGDSITSWSFKGAYSGNTSLIASTQADITHLESLLGKGQYTDYDLDVGIALDYEHLGDGASSYKYYNRAIKLAPTTGLAYVDLANLMTELKAYGTARDAYAKAVAVEPGQIEYHIQRLTFLTQHFTQDTALVAAAFSDASKVFGDNADILSVEAAWLTNLGKYADAITAWKAARQLSPPSHWPAIDAAIARLQAKE